MPKLIDPTGAEKGEASTIMAYFGKQPGQETAKFLAEVKALTPEAKTELAVGAAKALGYTIVN